MMIIKNKELLIPFIENNQNIPKKFIISDEKYYCPRKNIIKEKIYPKFLAALQHMNLLNTSDKWNCNEMCDAFRFFAKVYFKNETSENLAKSIAVGIVFYKYKNGGHARNIIYLNRKNTMEAMLFEPQNGKFYKLRKERLDSIFAIYI